ncbi:MAG: hypothetical protein A4S09_00735 [Proteobacteria bacterium SG_bin7]|nr:MAG: hypothetical protein A4S09_00735 [Proteobacteria bacterium SG_bin7]
MTYSHLFFTILFSYVFMASLRAGANDIMIFDVHKNIPLNNDEIVYKDYYINGGATDGIKKGMVLTVQRKSPIHDNLKNKSQGFLLNPMGRVQVIHVEQEFSIARLFSVQERDNTPITDLDSVMVGDLVDLATAHELKENLEKPSKKVSKREEKLEGEKDSASLIEKPRATPAQSPAPATPVSVAPPAIGLPKAPPVDKPSL